MPSKEHDGSSVVSLRLPDALLEHLDRYLDWMESDRGEKSSRNHAIRQAAIPGSR
jgi:metal-responsive CopG/Arc/MetJ family transcriptional regulator